MQVPTGAQAVGTRTPVRLVAVAAGVLVVDQASKAWALAALDDGPVNVVGDAVRFRLVRNTGGAFSLFSGLAPALAILATVLVVVVFRMGRAEDDRVLATGLALVFGGALGNLSDRVFREPGFLEGAVVDFVDVGPWPTFNVADTAIVVGALALVLFRNRSGRAQADP